MRSRQLSKLTCSIQHLFERTGSPVVNNHSLEPDDNGNIYVGPKVCNINVNDNGENKDLEDENKLLE